MQHPQSILITGASSGLGAALASEYAQAGVTLYLSGRDQERLNKIEQKCQRVGAEVQAKIIDVRDAKSMTQWVTTSNIDKPLDLVIANAGVSAGTAGGGESLLQISEILETNITGVINTVQPVVSSMQRRGSGHIVIISSLASFRGLPSSPAYSTSKAAVRTYGEALRGLLAKDGVNVTVITPGYIKTPMTDVNTFPMPFLLDATKAAQIIRKELVKNPARIAFPLPLYLLIRFLGAMPPMLTDPLFARLPGKKSI